MNRRRSCIGILSWVALTALIAACSSKQTPTLPKPPYPYDVPHVGEAQVTEVEVLRAFDGSLLEVRRPGEEPFNLTLSDAVAPMPAQPWGEEATRALDRLTRGKQVLVLNLQAQREASIAAHHLYQLGRVYVDGVDVAWAMVGEGNAWVAPDSQDAQLKQLENWARTSAVGLWSLPPEKQITPWDFAKIPPGKRFEFKPPQRRQLWP